MTGFPAGRFQAGQGEWRQRWNSEAELLQLTFDTRSVVDSLYIMSVHCGQITFFV